MDQDSMTKKFGVNLAHLQTLWEFQRCLKNRKHQAVSNMEFEGRVEMSYKNSEFEWFLITIENMNITFKVENDEFGDKLQLNSRRIKHYVKVGNIVTLVFRSPHWIFGNEVKLKFNNEEMEELFLIIATPHANTDSDAPSLTPSDQDS
ncbi:hypothetical protein ABEB36_003712 [Hypothenemus hampei]|uniref:Uncharacterized protein n=1 Tax=Hypothenemus hampei TaxID=57062 RepID=A0ABD1F0V5_HYPHA